MSNDDHRKRYSDDREESHSPEPPPIKIKPIAATKLQAFSVGTHKKTPYQKHKEENELKKKKETEEAAKVYAEFVASFEDPHDYKHGTKSSFVKSKTMVPRDAENDHNSPPPPTSASSFISKPHPDIPASSSPIQVSMKPKPSSYKPMPFIKAGEPSKPKPTMTLASRAKQQQNQHQQSQQLEEDDEEDIDVLARKEARAQKKRNLDTFLEQIKKEQEDREDRLKGKQMRTGNSGGSLEPVSSVTLRAAFEENAGSHDTGDPGTTNLYVGNINPTVDEMMICHEFAKYGPIASVKIMWPRTQEEHDRNRNCGFVSFMERSDAEQALKNLDGKSFHRYVMKVGWGKAVPLPPKPIFVLDDGKKPIQTGLPFNAQLIESKHAGSSKSRAEVTVAKPTNIQHVKIIHRMVERVIKHGPEFEAIIMKREENNPQFTFLFDHMSEEHVYYRWKLFSILQGDTKSDWRTEPFQMFEGGAWWIPPDVPFDDEGMMDVLLDSEDEEKERNRERLQKGALGKIARQRFEGMLRQITFQRGSIARAMAFAIDHADAADEVIEIIIKALIISETPIAVKLARLYLVSDILHNSGVHVANAWKYRMSFESKLINVFEHLNEIYRSISARLKAEQVRRHVSNILSAWETWMVFPQHHIDHLRSTFMKKSDSESRSQSPESNTTTSMTAPMPSNNDGDVDGIPFNDNIGNDAMAVNSDDVDGEPLDDDVDGEPLDDNLDGEPMADEDIDGEPMDDVDGEPLEEQDKPVDMNDMFA